MLFISPPFGNYLDFKNTISIKGSFTLYPRSGLIKQIFKTLRYDFKQSGWVNKIGLRNPGIDYAIQKYKNSRCIISIAILESSEIPVFNKKIPSNMNLELNVSCPNIDVKERNNINNNLYHFLDKERKWCIIKLSPVIEKQLIDNYYQQGFRQFHCSNTIPLPNNTGGLSGEKVKEANQELIPYIKNKYPDVTIIGGGGIQTINDINLYKTLGADHYACSTVFFNPYKSYFLHSDFFKKSNTCNSYSIK